MDNKGVKVGRKIVCAIKNHSWKNKLCHVLKRASDRETNVLIRCIAKDIVFFEDSPDVPLLQVEYFYNSKWKTKFVDILLTISINLLWIDQSVVSEEDEFEQEEVRTKSVMLRRSITSGQANDLNAKTMNFDFPDFCATKESSLLVAKDKEPSNGQILREACLTVLPLLKIEANISLSLLTESQRQQLTRVVGNTNAILGLMTSK